MPCQDFTGWVSEEEHPKDLRLQGRDSGHVTQQTLVRTLDLAYFPGERGPYNFEEPTDITNPSTLENPEARWGGIMRPLTTNNFEQANVEYIQFWMMDPYKNYSITNAEGLPTDINPQDLQNQIGDCQTPLNFIPR